MIETEIEKKIDRSREQPFLPFTGGSPHWTWGAALRVGQIGRVAHAIVYRPEQDFIRDFDLDSRSNHLLNGWLPTLTVNKGNLDDKVWIMT